MLKNLIIAALVAVQLVPFGYKLYDPKPIAIECLVADQRSPLCLASVWLWVQRDGQINVNTSLIVHGLIHTRTSQEVEI